MSSRQVRTEIPGPKSRALAARRAMAVPRGVPSSTPIAIAKAEGAILIDVDGNHLLDFGGGIGVTNVGHREPTVVAAIQGQLSQFLHVCFPVSSYEPYVALAERLNQVTPGRFEKRTFFVNSGAEAVENAVKIARKKTGRQAILCFEHGFHGRTNLAMALTSKVRPYKAGFGPFAGEVYRLPYPYCYRCEAASTATCCLADRTRFERHLAAIVDPKAVAAVIIEPQLGEGGFVPAPTEYLRMLKGFCEDHGIVFVADEIQTGFGRTGRLFACEHHDLEPDLLLTAKSLAGGLPLAGITGRADIMDAADPGGLGGTYGGNPLACAAALAVLEVMERDDLPGRAQHIGQIARERLLRLRQELPAIGDVRGLGAMLAIELVDPADASPDVALTSKVILQCLAAGLLLLSAGTYGNVIRLLMPLSIPDDQLCDGLSVLEETLRSLCQRPCKVEEPAP